MINLYYETRELDIYMRYFPDDKKTLLKEYYQKVIYVLTGTFWRIR